MKKLIAIFIALALTLGIALPASAHTENDPYVAELIAGQHYDAGDVSVWNDGDYLYVKYSVGLSWTLTETHLRTELALDEEGEDNLDAIPQKNGNPIPGKFKFDKYYDSENGYYKIPLSYFGDGDLVGETVNIAAHAVVQGSEVIDFNLPNLPDQVCIQVSHPNLDETAYFGVSVSGGTGIDGLYPGWCVDVDANIFTSETYCQSNVYSTYEAAAQSLVGNPENLPLVNWIINQDFVGQASTCNGAYTFGDVQAAIWQLVDGKLPATTSSINPWDECRTAEIIELAEANGVDYQPSCGDYIGIIIEPSGGAQLVLISLKLECYGEETAWAGDLEFPGKNWALYFEYEIQ